MHLSNWVMEALGQERRAGRRRHHPIDQTPLQQFMDVEEEFLHASEFGDVEMVKRLLAMYPQLDVDCTDALGRTAIRLAVKNEHLEVSIRVQSCRFLLASPRTGYFRDGFA